MLDNTIDRCRDCIPIILHYINEINPPYIKPTSVIYCNKTFFSTKSIY